MWEFHPERVEDKTGRVLMLNNQRTPARTPLSDCPCLLERNKRTAAAQAMTGETNHEMTMGTTPCTYQQERDGGRRSAAEAR